jgi:hypothetical protein
MMVYSPVAGFISAGDFNYFVHVRATVVEYSAQCSNKKLTQLERRVAFNGMLLLRLRRLLSRLVALERLSA